MWPAICRKVGKGLRAQEQIKWSLSPKASLNSVISLGQGSDCGTAAGAALGAVGRQTHKALLAGSWGIIRGWSVLLVCFLQTCPNVLRMVLVAGSTVPSNMFVTAVNRKRLTLVTCVPLDQG